MSAAAGVVGEDTGVAAQELKVHDFARYLHPTFNPEEPPSWPPDVFAICTAILQKSAAYACLMNDWPPGKSSAANWVARVKRTGADWCLSWGMWSLTQKRYTSNPTLNSQVPVPKSVTALWKKVFADSNQPIMGLRLMTETCLPICHGLAELCAIADEASIGFGVPGDQSALKKISRGKDSTERRRQIRRTQFDADLLLQRSSKNKNATLCRELHASRIRVLPKMHCPQSGLTIRSFSHNLAMYMGTEVNPTWTVYPEPTLANFNEALNLLVIPWPYVIYPSQIRVDKPVGHEAANMDTDNFGFFTVDHETASLANTAGDVNYSQFVTLVLSLIEKAQFELGSIDAVIFPELSLCEGQYDALAKALTDKKQAALKARRLQSNPGQPTGGYPTPMAMNGSQIVLIAGVGVPGVVGSEQSNSASATKHGRNQARVLFPISSGYGQSSTGIEQDKHHRWKLESHQIRQYGLGSRLHSERQWWEHISLADRQLNFFALAHGLVATIQICEDLARPDPVADMIRAVGPNLVIALLMDGPQLKERWPARYATTLADDPGSSVLTVTSLGMSNLSRASKGSVAKNAVVALWKDASGAPMEIELPDGYEGVVLSLTSIRRREWSADGRDDGGTAVYPTLTGIRAVRR